jgi:choloylglycine hydrolase
MEFPNLMGAKITVLPRGFVGAGIAPSGTGKTWTSKYGVVGVDAFGQPGWLTDGTNEKGVYAGLLYMPGFCDYPAPDGKDPAACMSIVNTVAYLLGTCASVAEAAAALSEVTVWPWTVEGFGNAPSSHLILHDASGASAVIEWRDGEMVIFDNPIGVATNSPHLDWHLLNLRNYLTLQPLNPDPVTIEGVEIPILGQGSGMRGLPADGSGPARFLRAVAYVATLRPVPDGAELEKSALHVLNNFDIPFGLVRASDSPEGDDHTLWSTISNLTDRRYVIRGYDNPTPQVIDLGSTDFTPGDPRQVPLSTGGFAALTV